MRGYTVLLPLVPLHYPLLPTAVHGTVRHPTAGRGRDPATPGDLHGRDIQPPWRAWDADLQRPVALNGAASFRSDCGSSLTTLHKNRDGLPGFRINTPVASNILMKRHVPFVEYVCRPGPSLGWSPRCGTQRGVSWSISSVLLMPCGEVWPDPSVVVSSSACVRSW
jgi:hypothetical protein